MPNFWTCVDASIVARLFTAPDDQAVRDLWRRWRVEGRHPTAPTLMRYEVSNALYRSLRRDGLDAPAVDRTLRAAFALPIQPHGDDDLHRQAVSTAFRFGLSAAYDAHYLALADRLGADFWTTDRKLANAVGGALPWVHLVGS